MSAMPIAPMLSTTIRSPRHPGHPHRRSLNAPQPEQTQAPDLTSVRQNGQTSAPGSQLAHLRAAYQVTASDRPTSASPHPGLAVARPNFPQPAGGTGQQAPRRAARAAPARGLLEAALRAVHGGPQHGAAEPGTAGANQPASAANRETLKNLLQHNVLLDKRRGHPLVV